MPDILASAFSCRGRYTKLVAW